MIGQSGVGKSSLINKLIPSATQKTGIVSTRHKKEDIQPESLGPLNTKYVVIIKRRYSLWIHPGIDSFGLEDLKHGELVKYFSEWKEKNQQYFFCKFKTCRHDCEPECGI